MLSGRIDILGRSLRVSLLSAAAASAAGAAILIALARYIRHSPDTAKAAAVSTKQRQLRGRRKGDTGKSKASTSSSPLPSNEWTVSGLVNLGNTCFLNSVIQALASLDAVATLLEQDINADRNSSNSNNNNSSSSGSGSSSSSSFSVQVAEQLQPILAQLRHVPSSQQKQSRLSRRALDTSRLLRVLNTQAEWIARRQEQDAHEALLMLVGAISSVSSIVQHAQASETSSLIPSILDLRTIGQLVDTAPSNASANANDSADGNRATHLRSPFEGLVATMVRCLECGYVSAVRHHLSSVLTLSLPHPTTVSLRMYGGAPLQQCLAEHFGSERLDDYICRRCAVTNTLALIETQVEAEHRAGRNGRSSPELAELCQARDQLRHALATNSIETVTDSESKLIAPPPNRRRCVRQTALARPPAVLALHLSRSLIVPSGHVVKNTSPVVFPAVLDIQRYTTTEYLESSSLDREANPSGGQYKLSAVIVHAGTHGSGHFVAYRRLSDGVSTEWFETSDEAVRRAAETDVLGRTDAYILFYERDAQAK